MIDLVRDMGGTQPATQCNIASLPQAAKDEEHEANSHFKKEETTGTPSQQTVLKQMPIIYWMHGKKIPIYRLGNG